MKGERQKDHRTRKLLSEYIVEHPGVTFQMLSSVFDIKESTLRYHIQYLMGQDEIVERKKKGLNVYFSNLISRGHKVKSSSAERNKNIERVLTMIKEQPGITRRDIKNVLGIRSKDLSYAISRLKERYLVWESETEYGPSYEPITRDRILDEMLVRLVEKLVRGEIDEKNFLRLKEEIDQERNG